MRSPGKNEKGFTLIEFMVAACISTIVLAAIYVVYTTQSRSSVAQEYISEMQQNLRAAMYMLSRDLRTAGYDPFSREDKSKDGIDNDCDGPYDEPGELIGILEATPDSITFNMSLYDGIDNDLDGDEDEPDEAGIVDVFLASANGLEPCGNNEIVSYSLTTAPWGSKCVGRKTGNAGNKTIEPEPIAENIEAINFVYLDEDRNIVNDGGGNVFESRDKIRSVQITMVAKSRKAEPKIVNNSVFRNLQGQIVYVAPGDHFRRLSQSVEIRCRNLGISQIFAASQKS